MMLKDLAVPHILNAKTVAMWRQRTFVHDAAIGLKTLPSTVLTTEDEALIVAVRRYTLLTLDDCLYALEATILHLIRSSLHRCLQRHGISRLPEGGGDKSGKQPLKSYPIGVFPIDIAEVRTGEGKLYLWAAIDRTSKHASAQLYERADQPRHPVRRAVQEPSRLFSMPTTSLGGSKLYTASRHTKRNPEARQTIETASNTIRPISPRD